MEIKNPATEQEKIKAEMEGFEPSHRLPDLPHFECGPFSHLGTSPCLISTKHVPLYKVMGERSIFFMRKGQFFLLT